MSLSPLLARALVVLRSIHKSTILPVRAPSSGPSFASTTCPARSSSYRVPWENGRGVRGELRGERGEIVGWTARRIAGRTAGRTAGRNAGGARGRCVANSGGKGGAKGGAQ